MVRVRQVGLPVLASFSVRRALRKALVKKAHVLEPSTRRDLFSRSNFSTQIL